MANEGIWRDEFNIGVDVVDKAHQRLFAIVWRLLKLNKENKDRWACAEGIKYFKSYAVKHFEEEEAYMRSINYAGLDMHKRLHDNMRDKTLVALEQNMEETGYSVESVDQFFGICIGWLTGHIMVEDRAITGRVSSKWHSECEETARQTLGRSMIDVVREIFNMESRIFSEYYGGERFGKTVNYRFDYVTSENKRVWVIMSVERKLMLRTIGMMTGVQFEKVDNTVVAATKQLIHQFLKCIGFRFEVAEGTYQLRKESLITNDAMKTVFKYRNPMYSFLVDVDGGCFAFCADGQ